VAAGQGRVNNACWSLCILIGASVGGNSSWNPSWRLRAIFRMSPVVRNTLSVSSRSDCRSFTDVGDGRARHPHQCGHRPVLASGRARRVHGEFARPDVSAAAMIDGLLVLWLQVAPGEVKRVQEWEPSEAAYEICQRLERFWRSRDVWAQCGEEF
jgi:hypothetical protein